MKELRNAGEGLPRARWNCWGTTTGRTDWHDMTDLEKLAYVALRDNGMKHRAAIHRISALSDEHNEEYAGS